MQSSRWTAFLSIAFALAAADGWAQRGSLRGKLVGESGEPIVGAACRIELEERGGSTVESKDDGQFVKSGLRPGTYTITCEKDGYRRVALATNVSGFEQTNLGETILYLLQPGEMSEADHARAEDLLEKFNMSSESGDDQTTLESLLELAEMMPDSPEVHFNIASTREQMGNQDEALEYYLKTTALKPDFYEAWLAIGEIYGKQRSWAQAQSAMKTAIDIQATDPIAVFNYAVYAQNAGDPEAAKWGYEKVLAIDSARALAHYQLGLIAVADEENAAALAHFEKFLELEPNHAQADAAKGVIEALKQKSPGF